MPFPGLGGLMVGLGLGALPDPTVNGTAVATGGTTTSNSYTVSLPTGIAAGETLLLFGASADSSTTISTLTGWTSVLNSGGAFVFKKTATGSEGASVGVTLSASVMAGFVVVRLSTQSGGIECAVAGGTSSDPPNLAPSWGSANTLWMIAAGIGSGGGGFGLTSVSVSAPYSLLANNGSFNTANPYMAVGLGSRGVVTQASENPANGTIGASGNTGAKTLTIGVRP